MKKAAEYSGVFAVGGVGYGLLELLWRGRTHWTMLLAGGLCAQILYTLACRCPWRRWQKCLAAGALITTVEFLTGVLVNLRLGWNVWDYSDRRFHLLGQICPLYTFLWTALSAPVLYLCARVEKKLRSR